MRKIDKCSLNEHIFSYINALKYEKGIRDDFIYISLGIEIANQLTDINQLQYSSSIEERPTYMGYPVEIDRRVPMRVSVCVEYPIPVYKEEF